MSGLGHVVDRLLADADAGLRLMEGEKDKTPAHKIGYDNAVMIVEHLIEIKRLRDETAAAFKAERDAAVS